MNGNEARTEGPNAALEDFERGMALSHVEQGLRSGKAVERVANSMTGAPTARPAGDD